MRSRGGGKRSLRSTIARRAQRAAVIAEDGASHADSTLKLREGICTALKARPHRKAQHHVSLQDVESDSNITMQAPIQKTVPPMRTKQISSDWIALIFIAVLGAIQVYFYDITFHGPDQIRDVEIARKLIHHHEWPLNGPPLFGERLSLPPGFYYLLALPFWSGIPRPQYSSHSGPYSHCPCGTYGAQCKRNGAAGTHWPTPCWRSPSSPPRIHTARGTRHSS